MTDLSKMLKKDLIIIIEKLKAENQNMIDQNKVLDKSENSPETEPVESVEFIKKLYSKKIDELLVKNEDQADEIQEFTSEVTELKIEIKTLTDRLNAKRKSIEKSGKASGKYPVRKSRNTKPRKTDPIEDTSCSSELESEPESDSNSDTSFDQELPKSKDLARRARKIINSDSSSAESDDIIKVPKAILHAARKSIGSKKKTATLHAFSTTKAAKTSSSKLTNNPRPNAKIPKPAAPPKMLSFYTSFLKRKSKNELIAMIEMQCFKLYKIGKQGTQRGQQDKKLLEKYTKDALVKICQNQEKIVQENTDNSGEPIDTFDIKYFEGAIEELKQSKYQIKKLFDVSNRSYSIHIEDFVNDLTILPKEDVKLKVFKALVTFYEKKSRNRWGKPMFHRANVEKKMQEVVDFMFAPDGEKSTEQIEFQWR